MWLFPHRRRRPKGLFPGFAFLFLLFPLSFLSRVGECAVLVLKNGKTYRGDVTRHDPKNFLLPGGKIFVSAVEAAWFSESNDTDVVIREWWEGIRNRPDLEDALLPLARFCLQEGRLKKGLRFAKEWGRFRGWTACLSKEFLFLTDMKTSYAKKVGVRMDAALGLLRKEFPGAEKKPYTCVVRLFKNLEDFQRITEGLPLNPDTSFYYPDERMIYLGRGNSPERRAEFDRIIADRLAPAGAYPVRTPRPTEP